MKSRILLFMMLVATTSFFSNKTLAQCSATSAPPGSWCWDSDAIVSLTIAGTTSSQTPSCGNSSTGYTAYSSPTWSFVKGSTVSWSVTFPNQWPEGFGLWIDFNNDGVLSGNEEVSNTSTTSSTGFSGSFTIPSTATVGSNIRMRARCRYNYASFGSGANDACASYTWGETEDYLVSICNDIVVSQQPSDANDCEGTNTSLSVTASNASGYQWQVDAGSGFQNVSGSNYTGGTTNTLGIKNMPSTFDGYIYRCIISSSCSPALKDTSNNATLTVTANAKITAQSKNDTTCEKITTKFGVKTSGMVNGYLWQYYKQGIGWIDITNTPPYSNITTDSLTINSIPDSLNGLMMRCIALSPCQADTSDTMSIAVLPLPKVVNDPTNVSVIQGGDALFTVTTAGLNIKYRWQAGYNGVYSFINNNAIYQGVTNDSLIVRNVTEAQNGFTYRCIVSGQGSCAADPDTSTVAILNVLPPLTINGISNESNISLYPNPVTGNDLTVTINNKQSDLTYKVINTLGKTVLTGNLPNTANHNTTINVTSLSSGIYTFQVLDNNNKQLEAIKFSKQ